MAKGPDWRGEQITAWPWVERGIEDRSYCPARLLEPRYCRMTDSVAARNINQGFARCPSRQCLLLLMWSKEGLSTKPHATSLGTLSAFAGPGQD